MHRCLKKPHVDRLHSPASTVKSNRLPDRPCRTTREQRQNRWRIFAQSLEIKLITSDVDGTLLDSQQRLTPLVQKAVKLSRSVGVPLVVATGKAPGGEWVKKTIPRLGPSPQPGVFMQGLCVFGKDGSMIFTRELERDVIKDVIDFGKQYNVQITAYSTDRILSEKTDKQSDRLIFYGEPIPETVGPLLEYTNSMPIQKMLVMDEKTRTDEIRPELYKVLDGRAEITVAIPGMLEVLPLGASKGAGVEKLLENLNISQENLMALGDGENDIGMLKMAKIGIHMGNAVPEAIEAADDSTKSNNEDGVAYAIEKHVLKPRGLSLDSEP